MKLNNKFSTVVLVATFLLFANQTIAQKKGNKAKPAASKPAAKSDPFGGGGTAKPSSNDPFGGGSTAQPPKTQTATTNTSGAAKPASNDPFASSNAGDPFGGGAPKPAGNQPPQGKTSSGFDKSLPITYQKTAGGDPLSDTIKPSLRNPSSIIDQTKDRMPLAWDFVREDDAIFRHKVWEVIDTREKINQPFMYKEDGGNNLFFAILVRSILEDSVAAFEHYDFRKELSKKEVREKCTGGMDTNQIYDLENNVIGLSVGKKEFPVDSVYQFQLLEEIFFDKEASKLVRRIIGVAPMGPLVVNGKVIPGQNFPYFWVYYPDLRKNLAKRIVYNPKNLNSNQTWEDYLESHQYSYYLVKTTMDNYKDQKYSEYIKDPLFRLFEGEKFKTQIFNYEQSLWAY